MSEFYKVNKSLIDKVIIFIVSIFCILFFFNNVITYFYPFILGYVISIIINPMVNLLVKRFKFNRGVAALTSIFLLLFILGVIGTAIVSRVIQEGSDFLNNLPQMVYYVENTINEFNVLFKDMFEIIPEVLQQAFYSIMIMILDLLTTTIGYGLRNFSTTFIYTVPKVAIGAVIAIISAYFFSKDIQIISTFLSHVIPNKLNQKFIIIRKAIADALGGYFKAQLILMTIVGSICSVGLLLVGTPYALFLSLIISVVDALPIFGSGIFYWPWIAFNLMTKNYSQAIGLSIIYITILLTRQALEPKILGKQLCIHPLITLMSIYIGLRFFGFLGIILGPCIAVILKSLIEVPIQENKA